jgi:hypothetical protein
LHGDLTELSPADACVTGVAAAAGLQDLDAGSARRPDELMAATGPVAWLAGAVVDHVLDAGARYRSQAGALGAAGPF